MSHNQRPGRIRMVGGAATPNRRRTDGAAGRGASAGQAPPSAGAGRLLTILFLLGCAAGGVALPLMGIAR